MRRWITERKRWLCMAGVCALVLGFLLFLFRPLTIDDVIERKRCFILGEQEAQMTLEIPVSALPDEIYQKWGYTFEKNEVVVYQTDNTTIYLDHVMPANEGDDRLYFTFRLSYQLTDEGVILTPYYRRADQMYTTHVGLRTDVLMEDKTSYVDAVYRWGSGTDAYFIFYVNTEACKAAEGTIRMDAYCWEIHYERRWPWS